MLYHGDGLPHTPVSALNLIFVKVDGSECLHFCSLRDLRYLDIYSINGKLIKMKFRSECFCVSLSDDRICDMCQYCGVNTH